MSVLCSGSVAVDHIMVFQGRFKDVILPDRIHMLNVAFHVPELRRSFGGTAANIAFNLRLLGEEPIVLATVGASDFDAYAAWLGRHGIGQEHILRLEGEATAGAYITTDLDDNQIIGFHPGAMDRAHEAGLDAVRASFDVGIVSPNGKRAMQEHARALKERGVRTVIDPGQGLPLFDRGELVELLDGADVYIVNDYEWELTLERTGLAAEELAKRVAIPPVAAASVVDPTGCGDAYRAAFLHGLRRGLPLETCARMGSLMGSMMVERHGTQSLEIDRRGFEERYRRAFGAAIG
jgi:adenosine kinase